MTAKALVFCPLVRAVSLASRRPQDGSPRPTPVSRDGPAGIAGGARGSVADLNGTTSFSLTWPISDRVAPLFNVASPARTSMLGVSTMICIIEEFQGALCARCQPSAAVSDADAACTTRLSARALVNFRG